MATDAVGLGVDVVDGSASEGPFDGEPLLRPDGDGAGVPVQAPATAARQTTATAIDDRGWRRDPGRDARMATTA